MFENQENQFENQNAKFCELLCEFDTAMLITRNGDRFRARPMAIAQVEDNCDLQFFTSSSSGIIEEIHRDPRLHITCQKDHGCYLSMTGSAKLSMDKGQIKKLWKESYKVWFPEGPEDPTITLISLKAKDGEYWDLRGTNRIRYLFQAITAYATGTTPHIEEGNQHGDVKMWLRNTFSEACISSTIYNRVTETTVLGPGAF